MINPVSIMKLNKKIILPVLIVIIILVPTVIGVAIYLNDYYHADVEAIELYSIENDVSKQVIDDTIIYGTEDANTGFIFYPGGKVEYTAYDPLMRELASRGIMCILVEMPFNLAVLNVDAAEGFQEQYADIEQWYIGGHSLGGSMAASYLADNSEDFEGLILLGSYSTEKLSDVSINVLSVYGSEDKVLNKEKYKENKENLPKDYTEVIIEGGCHAYFGMYGEQDGDGVATITNVEQIEITAEKIVEFIKLNEK